MKRIALFPGTFDPMTKGHLDVINKGLLIFDELIIAIGVNSKKSHLFSVEKRISWIEKEFSGNEKLKVLAYNGMTVEFCLKMKAQFILRGLRSSADFEYEKAIASANKELASEITTIFVLSEPSNSNISSTVVREIITFGGAYQKFVPELIAKEISKEYK